MRTFGLVIGAVFLAAMLSACGGGRQETELIWSTVYDGRYDQVADCIRRSVVPVNRRRLRDEHNKTAYFLRGNGGDPLDFRPAAEIRVVQVAPDKVSVEYRDMVERADPPRIRGVQAGVNGCNPAA